MKPPVMDDLIIAFDQARRRFYPEDLPTGAHWCIGRDQFYRLLSQIDRARDPFGDCQGQRFEERPLFGLPIKILETDFPIAFIKIPGETEPAPAA